MSLVNYMLQAKVWPVMERDIPGIKEALMDIGVDAHKVCFEDPNTDAVILGVTVMDGNDDLEDTHNEFEVQLRERLGRADVQAHTSWTLVPELSDEECGPEAPI